jgi:transposase
MPWDLSEWSSPEKLLAGVTDDIGSLDWANAELVELLNDNPAYQPRFLLTLLSYAYAMGVCESEEVVALYYNDANLRRLFPGRAPAAPELARFRRENRGLLKWCLTELFKRVLREKLALGDVMMPAGLRRYLVDVAAARLDVARDMDRTAHGAI